MQNKEPEQSFTEKSLAKRWGIDFKTLQKWRGQGIGPPYIKIGIAVRYSPESVKKYEEEHMHMTRSKNRSSYNKILFNEGKNYESKQN